MRGNFTGFAAKTGESALFAKKRQKKAPERIPGQTSQGGNFARRTSLIIVARALRCCLDAALERVVDEVTVAPVPRFCVAIRDKWQRSRDGRFGGCLTGCQALITVRAMGAVGEKKAPVTERLSRHAFGEGASL